MTTILAIVQGTSGTKAIVVRAAALARLAVEPALTALLRWSIAGGGD